MVKREKAYQCCSRVTFSISGHLGRTSGPQAPPIPHTWPRCVNPRDHTAFSCNLLQDTSTFRVSSTSLSRATENNTAIDRLDARIRAYHWCRPPALTTHRLLVALLRVIMTLALSHRMTDVYESE